MKKSIVLSIVALLVMSLIAGCGFGEDKVLDRMEKTKVLNVAFEGTYPPFNYLDDNGDLTGFDVDISNELAKRLGVKANFITSKWEGLIGGLKADKFDIIIGQMTVTEERKKV